jgi:c-di-GMP-binding flagellar brake protein YcgR
MKIITFDQDQEKIENILKNAHKNRVVLTVWQNAEGRRKVYISRIDHISEEFITFSSYYQKNYTFDLNHPVFVYCEKMNFIFKTLVTGQEMVEVKLTSPVEVTLLDAVETNRMKTALVDHSSAEGKTEKINDVLRVKKIDEDQAYAHLREAPRKKVSKEQKVTVAFLNKNFSPKEYDLFDLSTGGAGVLVKNQELFEKGEFLMLTHLDGRELNPPLKGEIMSIRSHDVEQGLYKIGLKFNT